MMRMRVALRSELCSMVHLRIRGLAETLLKYLSKSVKSMRFRPQAMASKIELTRSKWPSSDITPLLSKPGSRKSSTIWFCCTAAMSSSFEMEPLLSASMRSKISRSSEDFADISCATLWRKWAANSTNLTSCFPAAIASKTLSALSKCSSSVISVLAWMPGSTKSVSSWSRAIAAMSSSFETLPFWLESILPKTSRSFTVVSSSASSSSILLFSAANILGLCIIKQSAQRSKLQPCGQEYRCSSGN
mmetsp:Transcript_60700/g.172543  ORF Transcript_60700/g.172543 Transcript_60700/m.172543 type:complete len:246 (-) Transcript_60700:383-1120(-)